MKITEFIYTEISDLENNAKIKFLKLYVVLKIIFYIIITIFFIILCIELHSIMKEIQHFIYHAFDCCNYRY